MDTMGHVIIEPTFIKVADFSESKAAAVSKDGRSGYIDSTGNFIIEGDYVRMKPFSNGYAVVRIRKKGWAIIDSLGNIVFKPKSKIGSIENVNEYGLAKTRVGRKYRLISTGGQFLKGCTLVRSDHSMTV